MGRDVVIGDRTRMQNLCVVGRGTVIEGDCFLGPGVHLLSGRTMSESERKRPPVLRRGCQIGSGTIVMAGIEIGEEAVIGAGAVVTADVAPGTTVRGVPARAAAAALAEVAQLG
jgi:acetyltransferase-like isoleucine patch superfamily enzyme